MARKMRKFSAGGAQGKYDRRMADIKKDFEKDSKGKSGKALEVLEAKRAQRTADAEDDRAKRTGADRTATRAAEKAAESNLTKTRKYGAAKSVTQEKPVSEAKITDSLPTPKMDSSIGASKPTAKPTAKPPVRRSAPVVRTDKGAGTPVVRTDKGATPVKNIAPSKFDTKAFADLKARMPKPTAPAFGGTALRGQAPKQKAEASKPKTDKPKTDKPLTAAQRAAILSANLNQKPGGNFTRQAPTFDMTRNPKPRAKSRDETFANVELAKGGKAKTMKYANGGSTPSKRMPIGGKQLMPLKKKLPKEPITGGADTVPLTPGRKEFLKEMAKRNAKPGMAKGGKMASCGMKKGGKAATKFGAAMKKKSADTKGRAMMKFAKGGSIDGCAVKGKTKTSMVKMKKGGSC
jgi:hypothetical protein